MARTKQTARISTGGKAPRANLAVKAAKTRMKNNCPYAKKSRVPNSYYKDPDHKEQESKLSGGGGCLAIALQVYYVRFIQYKIACVFKSNINDCIRTIATYHQRKESALRTWTMR